MTLLYKLSPSSLGKRLHKAPHVDIRYDCAFLNSDSGTDSKDTNADNNLRSETTGLQYTSDMSAKEYV